jgi:hypothetical protein
MRAPTRKPKSSWQVVIFTLHVYLFVSLFAADSPPLKPISHQDQGSPSPLHEGFPLPTHGPPQARFTPILLPSSQSHQVDPPPPPLPSPHRPIPSPLLQEFQVAKLREERREVATEMARLWKEDPEQWLARSKVVW